MPAFDKLILRQTRDLGVTGKSGLAGMPTGAPLGPGVVVAFLPQSLGEPVPAASCGARRNPFLT